MVFNNTQRLLFFGFIIVSSTFIGVLGDLKIALLGALLLLSLFGYGISSTCSKYKISSLVILLTFYGYLFFSFGVTLYRGFQIDPNLLITYLLTPLIAFVVSASPLGPSAADLIRLVIVQHLCVLCLGLFQIVILSSGLFSLEITGLFGGVSASESMVQYRNSAQTTLMFTTPFILYYVSKLKRINFMWAFVVAITIFVCVLGGRRALQLALIISILPLVLRLNSKTIVFLGICLFTFSSVYLMWNPSLGTAQNLFSGVTNNFFEAFNENARGFQLRVAQMVSLWQGFSSSPFFGFGVGGHTELIRNTTPWSYELVYNALLMQLGAIGFLLLFTVLGMIAIRFWSTPMIKINQSRTMLFAFTVFLVCGATNPMVYMLWFWLLVGRFYVTVGQCQKNGIA